MKRRDLLVAIGSGGLLAGCLASPAAPDEGVETATTPAADGSDSDPEHGRLANHGIPPDICETSIRADPGIYAIVDPAFDSDWSSHAVSVAYRHDRDVGELAAEQTVIGLEGDGIARAYPLSVLNTHEIVNDTVGRPVIVTFCPLCSSGMVADRRIDGEPTLFAVTGLLWQPERIFERASEDQGRTFGATYSGGETRSVRHNGNLVMYDAATRSYWSQILARGICGPHTATELDIHPSTVATWAEWRERHPDTEVLLPPPHSTTVEPDTVLGSEGRAD